MRLTAAGRKAFLRDLAELERLLRDARSEADAVGGASASDGPAPRRA